MHRPQTLLLMLLVLGCAAPDAARDGDALIPTILRQEAGVETLLVGLDAVSDQVVWTAGTEGTYGWTADGGDSWSTGVVPGADTLQFRDVHAFSLDEALLLSIGPGGASRIYHTTDRGSSWQMVFRSPLADAFYDCFDFWEDGEGLVFSDAVDGTFPIARLRESDTWSLLPIGERPAAQPAESGFAASGTCLITGGDATAWIGTGNVDRPRVLRTDDRGATWSSAETPLQGGEAAGITTLAFRGERHGVALGGDLARPTEMQYNAVRTDDGGKTWHSTGGTPFPGAVYGSTYVPGTSLLLAVGPGGAAYSYDDGSSWSELDSLSHWSVDAAGPEAVWAVGPEGRVTKIEFTPATP